MMLLFFAFLSHILSEEWKIPEKKDVSSGWNGWPYLLLPISGLFDRMKIADYIVHANIDFPGIMTNAINNAIGGKLNVTQLFYENVYPTLNDNYVYDGKPSEITISFDAISKEITDEIMDGDTNSTNFFIGFLIGFAFTLVLLIVLFIVSLFYCLSSCCCCCCACRPREYSRPSIFSHVCFYIGIGFLAVVAIAVFYMIRPITSIISSVEHFPAAGAEIVVSGNITIDSVLSLFDEIPILMSPLQSLPSDFTTFLDEVAEYLIDIINSVQTMIREGDETTTTPEGQKSFVDIMEYVIDRINQINQAIENINNDVEKTSAQYGQEPPDPIQTFDFNDQLQETFETVNNSLDIFTPYIDQISLFVDDISSSLEPMFNDLIEMVDFDIDLSDYTESFSNIKDEETFIYEVGSLMDSTNPEGFGETWKEVENYLYLASKIAIAVFVAFGMIWVFTILIYVYAFNSHSCCGRCVASCNCCCPCFCAFIGLIFGIIGTLFSVIIIYANDQLYDTVDLSLDAIAASFPNRMIAIPKFTIYKNFNDFVFHLDIDPINFTFQNDIRPLTNLLSASQDESLCELWDLENFFKFEENKGRLEKLPNKVNNELQPSVTDLVISFTSDLRSEVPDDITDMNVFPETVDETIQNVRTMVEDLKQHQFYPMFSQETKDSVEGLTEQDGVLDQLHVTFDSSIPTLYGLIYNELDRRIFNVFSEEGFPAEYDKIIAPHLVRILDSLSSLVINILDFILQSTTHIDVHIISGFVSYFSNMLFFDLGEFFTLVSIACHLQMIGLFICALSLWIRRRGMLDKPPGDELDDAEYSKGDMEDLDDSSNSAIVTKRKKTKKAFWTTIDTSSDSIDDENAKVKVKEHKKSDGEEEKAFYIQQDNEKIEGNNSIYEHGAVDEYITPSIPPEEPPRQEFGLDEKSESKSSSETERPPL